MAPARVGRLVFMVAIIIALRVLGISALLPVFSPYALTLSDSGFLVGLAFGGYGLTMAFMQVPLGSLSDRWGRRPVLLLGLTAYVAGNVLAWWAPTIQWLIIARLVEGAGAVSSVALALLTDAVGEERRTMSIAVAGIGAGVSFLLGIAFGPFVADAIGVPGLFLASAILGLVVMGLVAWWAPGGRPPVVGDDSAAAGFWQTLGDRRGVALDLAGFAMNATLAATMLALPLLLVGAPDEGIDGRYTREAYRLMLLVTVLIGGVLAIGAARAADRRGAVRGTAVVASLVLGSAAATLLLVSPLWALYVAALVYFGAHAAQSASLPSLVGKLFSPRRRGAAMGALNSTTYLGSFVGGILGGVLWNEPLLLASLLVGLALLAAFALAGAHRPATVEPPRRT